MASTGTKITILVDNNAIENTSATGAGRGELASEHGLALWIESGGKRILLDTGQGPALAANIPVLGIDLSTTDVLVLSHGHYDHTGGVPQVLREAPRIQVYCHPGVFRARYAVREGKAKPIGIPRPSARALTKLPQERFSWVLGPAALPDQIGVTGPIPRAAGFEDTGGPFYEDKAGRRPDPIEDDLALWIRTEEGLVVCCGCAHSGTVNTLEYVRHLNPGMSIRAIIGGFHLLTADTTRLANTVADLGALKIPLVVPCHCTGATALQALSEALGERVSQGAAGMVLEF